MFKVPEVAQNRLPDLLKLMPKAELHIHIEGSLEPELIFRLAKRNNVAIAFKSIEELRSAYAFTNVQTFLDNYYAGASVLIHEQDFYEMAWEYFLKASSDNVVHAEIFFDPQTHTSRGIPMKTIIEGLARACRDAAEKLQISSALILCFLRHLSEQEAFETLEQALPFKDHFIGVGLDSSELGHPPEKFAAVFAKCRDLGLHLVAHAGEEGPIEYIWSALKTLGVERIDHGVQSSKDPDLIKYLSSKRIPLTVCPLSNVKLKVFAHLSEHNIGQMLEKGLCVTINSDDPAYFGGYINQNFIETFEALKLDAHHAYSLAHNSFEASFASAVQKEEWYRELGQCFKRFTGKE